MSCWACASTWPGANRPPLRPSKHADRQFINQVVDLVGVQSTSLTSSHRTGGGHLTAEEAALQLIGLQLTACMVTDSCYIAGNRCHVSSDQLTSASLLLPLIQPSSTAPLTDAAAQQQQHTHQHSLSAIRCDGSASAAPPSACCHAARGHTRKIPAVVKLTRRPASPSRHVIISQLCWQSTC
jgi:hypothetical protein